MKTIACPICDSNEYEVFKKVKNKDYYSCHILPEKFISICCQCGLIYQNPCLPQEEMNLIYRKYEDKISDFKADFSVTRNENLRKIKGLLPLFKPPKQILEIGCSDGVFLIEMTKHGFECVGVDPSKVNFEKFMKSGFEKEITYLNDFFENVNLPGEYDIIFHHFVLEHCYNPKNFLLKAKQLIKKNGVMIFEVPSVKKFPLLPFAIDLFPYQHIISFHSRSLQNLLNLTGWKISNEFKLAPSSKTYGMKVAVRPIKQTGNQIDNCYQASKQILKNYFAILKRNKRIIQKKLKPLIEKSRQCQKGIVIFGAGENGQFITENTNISQEAAKVWFCDSNKNLWGKEIRGIKVSQPLKITDLDFCAVIVASIDYQEDIISTLKELNVEREKIFKLYD